MVLTENLLSTRPVSHRFVEFIDCQKSHVVVIRRFSAKTGLPLDETVFRGHDGGSAAFKTAADPKQITLRNTMYESFKHSPPLPPQGLVPEFIQKPGRVTRINLFLDREGYVMRTAMGESVDTGALPVHHEHLMFKPDLSLEAYFRNMMRHGVNHHFMFGYSDWAEDFQRLAELLGMPVENVTTDQPNSG